MAQPLYEERAGPGQASHDGHSVGDSKRQVGQKSAKPTGQLNHGRDFSAVWVG